MASRPRPKRALAPETDLVANILAALARRGVWSWRVNSSLSVVGATKTTARRVIKGAPAGTPDILGVLRPSGVLFGLEAKVAGRVQNPAQRVWEARAQLHGARYRVVRSVSDALAAVDEWGTETACSLGGVVSSGERARSVSE